MNSVSTPPRRESSGALFSLPDPLPVCRQDRYVAPPVPVGDGTRAVVMRDGLFVELPRDQAGSEQPLICCSEDDRYAPRLTSLFQSLGAQFPEEASALAPLLARTHAELSAADRTPLEEMGSMDELFRVGLRLRQKVEQTRAELEKLKGDEKMADLRETLAGMGEPVEIAGSPYSYGNERQSEYMAKLSEFARKRAVLQERLTREEEAINQLADLVSDIVIERMGGNDAQNAVAFGTIGSMTDALGLESRAHGYFKQAKGFADACKDELSSRYYELHMLRTLPETEKEDWKAKIAAVEQYAAAVNRLSSEARALGHPVFTGEGGLSVAVGGDEAAYRTMQAGALSVLVGVRNRHGLETDDDEFVKLHKAVIAQMREATERPGDEREASALNMALAGLEEVRMREAAEASREGNLEPARDFGFTTKDDAWIAERMCAAVGGGEQSLAMLLDITHFSIHQQSGLPIDGVYNWWQHVYRNYNDVEAVAAQAAALRRNAPHLFDAEGELKPRNEITPPPDGAEAGALEGNLHIATGSMGENVLIGGSATLAGAAVGAKAGAGAGTVCGPAAEICIPVGGGIGAVAGFFFGDRIVKWLHADEVKEMEDQNKLAGLNLMRTTREESQFTAGISYVGYALGGTLSFVGGSASAKAATWSMGSFARASFTREGWKAAGRWTAERSAFAFRELAYEGKHAVNYAKGGWAFLRGMTRFSDPGAPKFVQPNLDKAFELIYARLSPAELAAKNKLQWRAVFDDLVTRGDTSLFRAPKSPLKFPAGAWDDGLAGFNRVLDGDPIKGWRLARLDRAFRGRIQGGEDAIAAGVPGLVESRMALMGRKELLRHAFRMESGFDFEGAAAAAAAKDAKELAAAANRGPLGRFWFQHSFGSKEFQKLYRLGMIPAGMDYAFVKQNGDGTYDLVPWDGKIDTGWGVGSYIVGTAHYSTRVGLNTNNGGIMGGGIKGLTFVGFLGLAGLAATDPDIAKIKGSQDEYLIVLPATLLLYGGMHAKGGNGSLLRALSQTPFVRRIPSLSSYTSFYVPKSAIGNPNFFTRMPGQLAFNGKGTTLSLGYTIPFIMGVTAWSGKELLGSDPYMISQRGWKFFFVGTFLNPTQIAMGGDTARAQGGVRLLGILFDIVPAMFMSPYYNNRPVLRKTLSRMALENGPKDKDEELNLFFSQPDNWMNSIGLGGVSTINRTLDLVGVMKRPSFNPADTSTWHAGWRWERDGMESWLDSLEGYTKDKDTHKDKDKKVWIKGVAQEHPEIYAGMAEALYHRFEQPQGWMGSEHQVRGMMIASIMAKWYAERARKGEKQFEPFARLVDQAPAEWRTGYWDKVPQVSSREEFLRSVSTVQETPIEQVAKAFEGSYRLERVKP